MKKSMVLVLILALVMGLIAGCSNAAVNDTSATTSAASASSAAAPTEASKSAEKITIGVSWMDLTTEYQAGLKSHLDKEIADKYPNVELIHMDGGSDASNQVSQVENLISQGVKAVLMVPYDRNGLVPAVEACADAGIPMIELCQETNSEMRTSFVGSIHYDSGTMLMEALAAKSGGKGKVVFLEGPVGQDAALARTESAKEVMKKYPDMEIVAEKVADWDRAAAMSAVENIIQAGIDFDIVYGESDTMALGAIEAIKGTDLEGKVLVGGIDAISDAVTAIKDGSLYCTAFQNSKQQAITGLEVAIKAANGEQVDKTYIIPFELVTIENCDDPKYSTSFAK